MSEEDRQRLSGMFGISEKYFERDGTCFQLGRLEEKDWKCYFNDRYDTGYNICQERIKESERSLKAVGRKRGRGTSGKFYFHLYLFYLPR